MVRGYQKRVIHLKNTNSKYFEEAYFVLNERMAKEDIQREELIFEANRIVEENYLDTHKKDSGGLRSLVFRLLGFAVLVALPSLLFAMTVLLFF